MRMLLAVLLLAGLASVSNAQTPRITGIEIAEVGIYQDQKLRNEIAPGTIKGTTSVVTNIKLLQATTRIPARVGVTFGLRYRIVGEPRGSTTTIRIVHIIPEPGIRDPNTGKVALRDEVSSNKTIGDLHYNSLVFEYDRDLVPGTWVFEFWDGARKLAEQKFDIFKP
jgi:hypothetical protein